jgi:hypothetical protein
MDELTAEAGRLASETGLSPEGWLDALIIIGSHADRKTWIREAADYALRSEISVADAAWSLSYRYWVGTVMAAWEGILSLPPEVPWTPLVPPLMVIRTETIARMAAAARVSQATTGYPGTGGKLPQSGVPSPPPA